MEQPFKVAVESSPVVGTASLSDGLTDVSGDLKRGSLLWESGHEEETAPESNIENKGCVLRDPNPSSPSHYLPSAATHPNSQAENDPRIQQKSDLCAADLDVRSRT